MVVVADHGLHGAGQQLVLGIDPGRLRLQFHVQAGFLEVAQAFGQLGRQVDELVDAANHDDDLVGGMGLRRGQCQGAGGDGSGAGGDESTT